MTDIAMYHLDDAGIVRFSLKNITRRVSGPAEAVQLVAFAMFTEPGSCFFARHDGGGMLQFKGKNIPSPQQLRADAAVMVRQAFDTVRRAQRPSRPPDATVVGLDLIDAYGVPESATIRIKIRIRLQTGNSFTATFEGQ